MEYRNGPLCTKDRPCAGAMPTEPGKPATAEPKTVRLLMPVLNLPAVFNNFGTYNEQLKSHTGNDIACAKGCAVVAARSGTVEASYYNVNFIGVGVGHVIEVRDREFPSLLLRYMHLSDRTLAEPGDEVEAGQLIAFSGDTGSAGSYHLHFEISVSGGEKNLYLNTNNRHYPMKGKAFTQDAYLFRSSLSGGNHHFDSLPEMLQRVSPRDAGYRTAYDQINRIDAPPHICCKVPDNLNADNTSWMTRGMISSPSLILSVRASIQNGRGEDTVKPADRKPSRYMQTYMYDMAKLDGLKFSSLSGQPGNYFFCVEATDADGRTLRFRHPFTASGATARESMKQVR